MLFNSIEFLIFLPVVFVIYWMAAKSLRWQNFLVLIVSYFFYGWWNWRYLFLIFLTSLSSFLSGLLIEREEGNRKTQKCISASNIILNILILGIFKYYNFFVENINAFFGTLGYQLDWVTLNVILPVGISFYTFQALSYTIDVYQYKVKATHDPIDFFAYISFFPQLVAGPIERATNLLPQFQKKRTFDYDKAVDGCRQMLWGFFKKIVVADNCAIAVNSIWGGQFSEPGFILLIGAVLFAFQIYCDFSGYSDIAIGCARLFGINLSRNFNFPYFSRSIPDFWRRWHISLTTWFRDYIYIPLGGSRCGKLYSIRNVFIVWGISGLWHGANWTFVFWGLYHASLLTIYNTLGVKSKYRDNIACKTIRQSVKEVLQMVLTFGLIVVGWVFFRSETMSSAVMFLSQMFSITLFDIAGSIGHMRGLRLSIIIPAVLTLLIVEWAQRNKQHALQFSYHNIMTSNVVSRYFIYLVLSFAICWCSGAKTEFIYFQF